MGCAASVSTPNKYVITDHSEQEPLESAFFTTPSSDPPDLLKGPANSEAALTASHASITAISKLEAADQHQTKEKHNAVTLRSGQLSPRSASKRLGQLFQTYESNSRSPVAATNVPPAPVSWPKYDPLLDEIFAVKASGSSSRASNRAEPLVSPKYVSVVADIFGVNVITEPFLVPVLKYQLTSLASAYHRGLLDASIAASCLAEVKSERGKHSQVSNDDSRAESSASQASCEECGSAASCYCPACEDVFCQSCFRKLHAKGKRAEHPRLDLGMAGFKMKENPVPKWRQAAHLRWHPFYDSLGVKYYHNFESQKTCRELSKKELMWQPPPPLPL